MALHKRPNLVCKFPVPSILEWSYDGAKAISFLKGGEFLLREKQAKFPFFLSENDAKASGSSSLKESQYAKYKSDLKRLNLCS